MSQKKSQSLRSEIMCHPTLKVILVMVGINYGLINKIFEKKTLKIDKIVNFDKIVMP